MQFPPPFAASEVLYFPQRTDATYFRIKVKRMGAAKRINAGRATNRRTLKDRSVEEGCWQHQRDTRPLMEYTKLWSNERRAAFPSSPSPFAPLPTLNILQPSRFSSSAPLHIEQASSWEVMCCVMNNLLIFIRAVGYAETSNVSSPPCRQQPQQQAILCIK